MKTIELKDLNRTKMSDLIRSVILDTDRMKKLGFRLDMDKWFTGCTVCLGGAAACGFLPDSKIKEMVKELFGYNNPTDLATEVNHGKEEEVAAMIYMFNFIRRGFITCAIQEYNEMVSDELKVPASMGERIECLLLKSHVRNFYEGEITKEGYTQLKNYLNFLADLFEEQGY